MIAIVTGSTGCLGFNLTRRLRQEGHQVIALGRNQRMGQAVSELGATFVAMDLSERDHLERLFRGADVIFHCAALSSPWGKYEDFYQSNVIGTQHVIEATPAQARLVYVSSPSIYFDFKSNYAIKEDEPLPKWPANYYIKSKRLAEKLIDNAYDERQLNVVTLRPRAIFGPYDQAILPRLLRAEKQGVLPLIGSGENIIDVTFVDNVVDSLLLAAQAGRHVCGKKYNITNDDPKPLIEIITLLYTALQRPLRVKHIPYPLARIIAFGLEKLYGVLPGEPLLTQYSAGVLALGQTLNIDAAKQDLHYQPSKTIEQGMRQFAAWYTE